MKFFSRRRFNCIDAVAISFATLLFNQGRFGWGFAVSGVLLIVSTIAEAVWGQ